MLNAYLSKKFAMPILSILFAGAYSTIAFFIVGAPFLSILIANIVTFGLFFSTFKLFKEKKYLYIFISVVLIKLVLLILNAKFKFPLMAGVDWINYDLYAKDAISNANTIADIFNQSIDFFVFLMACIYKIFGSNVEQVYFYIFPFSLLLVKYVYKIAFLVSNKEKTATIAALVMLLWPVNIIFSIALLREIPIQLLVAASFYNFLVYYKQRKGWNLLYAFIFIILATLMHSGMVGIFVVYLYVLMQIKIYHKVKPLRVLPLVLAGSVLLAFSLTPLWDSMFKRFTPADSEDGVVTSLENQNKYLGDAATNYINSAPQNFNEVVTSAPYRLAMFALAPLPWQVYSFSTLISFVLDGILQLGILCMLLWLFKKRRKLPSKDKSILAVMMMCIVVTYLVFSFGTSNYGTAMRHRAKVAPIIAVIGSVYFLNRPRRLYAKN